MRNLTLTKKIAGTAVFVALAYLVSFLEFPIFPAAPFLKLDFSTAFSFLAGLIYGPVSGGVVCALKGLLWFLTKTMTGGVGELADFIVSVGFILIPAIVYRKTTKTGWLIFTSACACLLQIGLSLLMNRFLMFPLYMGEVAATEFRSLWIWVFLFNLIKSVTIGVLSNLIYRPISRYVLRNRGKTE